MKVFDPSSGLGSKSLFSVSCTRSQNEGRNVTRSSYQGKVDTHKDSSNLALPFMAGEIPLTPQVMAAQHVKQVATACPLTVIISLALLSVESLQ